MIKIRQIAKEEEMKKKKDEEEKKNQIEAIVLKEPTQDFLERL